MGRALGDVLPLAVAVAVFPVPIVGVVLVVGSDDGLRKAGVFCVAWLFGLMAVGAIVLVLAELVNPTEDSEPATWTSILLLALGVTLLGLAVRQWRGRPRAGDDEPMPGWMRKVDEFTVVKAAGAGFALSALNPKNVLLVAAAAVEIAETALAGPQQAVVLVAFAFIASFGVLAPLALAIFLGDRAPGVLGALRSWLAANNAVIMVVLFVVIGAKLVGDAISGFSV